MQSDVLGGLNANFNLFIPANAAKGSVPILVYLSGLTCTEDNAYAGLTRIQHHHSPIFTTDLRKEASSETQLKRALLCSSQIPLPEVQELKAKMTIGILERVRRTCAPFQGHDSNFGKVLDSMSMPLTPSILSTTICTPMLLKNFLR